MSSPDLAAKIKASQRPMVWRAAATACRAVRPLSRNRRLWSSRLGYALERLDEARDRRQEAMVERRLLREGQGEAAAALRQAQELADSDDRAGVIAACQRAVELAGADDPRWRVKLAARYEEAGQWDRAQQVLQDNTAQHPRHAVSQRRLGEVALLLWQWGGTLADTLPERAQGTFRPIPATESAAIARAALERAAQLEPEKTVWREALAEAQLADGDLAGAAELYTAALRDAEQSTGRWVLAVKHRWQFQLESIYHRMGQPRVTDPLFGCSVEPAGATNSKAAGLFQARFVFGGLAISGLVTTESGEHVEILLDGVPVRDLKLSTDRFLPQFQLEIKRSTLASFPPRGELSVRSAAGEKLLAPGGVEKLAVSVPHGTGRLAEIIAGGGKLDKKGVISPSLAETRARQERYLEIYTKVRDFFEQRLGRSLFLMYGTLLGYVRSGDFIPGDDDFDAGYVSDATNPVAVKEETKGIIIELLKAGFTVSFNRKGRLFRVQLEREATDGFHLDLRPIWFQDGNVWVHNHASFPSRRDDFLPVVDGELRGVRVSAPRDAEKFLRNHYGAGWRVPDPGFMYYPSEVEQSIHDNLAQALITVREYRELAERVRREVGDSASTGRLVSVGSQDLYPLAQFLP